MKSNSTIDGTFRVYVATVVRHRRPKSDGIIFFMEKTISLRLHSNKWRWKVNKWKNRIITGFSFSFFWRRCVQFQSTLLWWDNFVVWVAMWAVAAGHHFWYSSASTDDNKRKRTKRRSCVRRANQPTISINTRHWLNVPKTKYMAPASRPCRHLANPRKKMNKIWSQPTPS